MISYKGLYCYFLFLFHRLCPLLTMGSNDEHKVYVGGLNYEYRQNDLMDYFGSIGNINRAYVSMEPEDKTKSRGFGFVVFNDADSANAACEKFDGTRMPNGKKPLKVQIAGIGYFGLDPWVHAALAA